MIPSDSLLPEHRNTGATAAKYRLESTLKHKPQSHPVRGVRYETTGLSGLTYLQHEQYCWTSQNALQNDVVQGDGAAREANSRGDLKAYSHIKQDVLKLVLHRHRLLKSVQTVSCRGLRHPYH